MTNPKSRIIAAVAGALSMGAVAAWAAEPTAQDAKIQELEQKVAALENKQAQNTQDLAATIDKVLRDAEQRSQLLATNGESGAGYDNGFYIRSGSFLLRPQALFQFRGVADYRQDTVGDKSDETETGFEVRRMKFQLAGTAFTQDLTYFFQWNSDVNGGTLTLEDAWVRYMFADEWGTRAGQFKELVGHEWLVDDGRVLAVDRSLLDSQLGSGFLARTQGISLLYGGYNANNPIAAELAFTDGLSQQNTDFTKHVVDFGITGRIEWKAMGDWKDYQDFTAKGNKDSLLVFGLGGDWSQAGDGNVLTGGLDGQWETNSGLGVYGAVMVRNIDSALTGFSEDTTDWGGLIQAGYMLNPAWEIFARYDFTDFDQDIAAAGNENLFHEATVGVNYYLGKDGSAGHRAKITVDLSWLPNGAPQPVTGLGFTGDSNGGDEFVLRGQFQLYL